MQSFVAGEKVKKLINDHNAQIVDVRTPQEVASGTAPGAINIPVQILPHRAHELDKDRHVIVFCRSGARSTQAHMILSSLGFEKVNNAGSFQNLLSCFEPV